MAEKEGKEKKVEETKETDIEDMTSGAFKDYGK